MEPLTLAIDQGTHSTRAMAFDPQGRVLAQSQQAVGLYARSHSEVEQDPDELLASVHRVIHQVLEEPVLAGRRIGAAGLATQRSSVVAWDKHTGEALAPVLSWQDRRCAQHIATLAAHEHRIAELTGLRLSPHYGAGKLHWLLGNVPAVAAAARDDRLLMGPLASYLLYHLLAGGPACVDHANASRMLLCSLQTRDWDEALLQLFGIPRGFLPDCLPVCADYGRIRNGNIPLRAVNGDQTAALYALGAPQDNTILVNIGTGAFVLLPVDDPGLRPDGLLAGISQSDTTSGRYYIEGTVNGAGAALAWAAQHLAIAEPEQRLPDWLDEITSPGLFINTVGGLGAPWWRAGPPPYFEAQGMPPAEAMVAVAESILFLIQANIALLRQARPSVGGIRISGGLSRLDGLCQRLADLSGLEVQRPPQVEATARGIAWQAAGLPADWPATGPVAAFTPRTNPGLRARYERFAGILQAFH